MQRPLLEKHIRLVNQHDCLPSSGNVEDLLQGVIKARGRGSEVTSTNDIQRPLDMLTRRLCRESLSNAGWAEKIDYETMTLAFDKIIEADFLVVSFDEGLEEVLAVAWEDQVGECVRIPVDVADFLDVEFHYK